MQECVRWPDNGAPAPYQLQAADDLWLYKREAIRAPRGSGKTCLAAILILWFAITREGMGVNWKVLTTASAWRQLTHYLWPEIRMWAQKLDWERLGRLPWSRYELQQMRLKLVSGEAFAVASDDPAKIEGAHAKHLLWVFDESKSIPDGMFDAAEGSMVHGQENGAEVLALAISTPGRRRGRFYEMFQRRTGLTQWHTTRVTATEAVAAGRVSETWLETVKALWGADSALYQTHAQGEFADESTNGLIPLEWVEAAVARWNLLQQRNEGNGHDLPDVTAIGVDVGEGGDGGDPTVLAAVRGGLIVDELVKVQQFTPGVEEMEVAALTRKLLLRHQGAHAFVDSDGIGAGVTARLREMGHSRALAFHAGRRTDLLDASGDFGFANWRSAMWWLMREMLTPDSGFAVALPPDDELVEELTTPVASLTSDGKHRVEAKDQVMKRLKRKRSTNCADAVLQALIGPLLYDELTNAGRQEVVYVGR